MTTIPIAAEFIPSPFHQGSRSRTGDQVDAQLVHDLLAVLGDCRLLWLPNLTDATTSAERSRHGATITWSESLATFDASRTRLGSGAAQPFNGSDEEGDVPDAARYSFGDGAVDQPFSVLALINPDTVSGVDTIAAKWDETTGTPLREWWLALNSGQPELLLYDESAGAQIGRQDATALATGAWALVIGTYDGAGSSTGLSIAVDGARLDDTDRNSGTYTAMEDSATKPTVAFHVGASADEEFFDGKLALVAITAKALTIHEMWAVKELVNGYFGLNL